MDPLHLGHIRESTSSWQYRRLMELVAAPGKKRPEDHWDFQQDTKNMMAERLVPVMVSVLALDGRPRPPADILAGWQCSDDIDLAAPTAFQQIFREFYLLTFQDDLGTDLTLLMGWNNYFRQERLMDMMTQGESSRFDDAATRHIREGVSGLLVRAGILAVSPAGFPTGFSMHIGSIRTRHL